jgi:phosphate-selective porin
LKKAFKVLLLLAFTIKGYSQNAVNDSLREVIDNIQGRLTALDERVLVNETDLGKLNKIKLSGYVQAQWESYGKDIERSNGYNNTFYIRRARLKITYEATDGVKFVLQPDFSTGNLTLKDAYAVVNLPSVKNLTLWAGQMNRPNYEVEYSSGQREVLERSRFIRAIYPGEREIGAKLEYIGLKTPLKVQLMAMNGNFTGTQAKDVDSHKDIMARLVYSIKMPAQGIGIDIGANGYFGKNLAKTNKYYKHSDGALDSLDDYWRYMDKRWFGGEIQIYADVLGGMAVKGEFATGVNSTPSTIAYTATMTQKKASPNLYNNFTGYYLYFIKNIGERDQVIARYDYYDPNTSLSGEDASGYLAYKTWTISLQHYLNDFIRISVNYEMPKNETNSSNIADIKDNVLGVRVQAKF